MNFRFPPLRDADSEKLQWIQNVFSEGAVSFEAANFIPGNVYQYRRYSDYSVYQLERSCVHLSNPARFADLYDCIINISEARSMVEAAVNRCNRSFSEENFVSFFENIRKLQGEVRVSCVTDGYECPRMWNDYADDSRGFCIEYNYRELLRNCNGSGHAKIFPVIYTNLKMEIANLIGFHRIDDVIQFNITSDIMNALALTKAKQYQYENEWRIFERIENIDNCQCCNSGRDALIWSEEINGEPSFYAYIPVSRVFLGRNMRTEAREHVKEIARRRGYEVICSGWTI